MKKQPTVRQDGVTIKPLLPQPMETDPDGYLRVLAEVVETVIRRQEPQDPQLPITA